MTNDPPNRKNQFFQKIVYCSKNNQSINKICESVLLFEENLLWNKKVSFEGCFARAEHKMQI